MGKRFGWLVITCCAFLIAPVCWAGTEAPLTVSLGNPERFLVAESACPTFSWASVAGARVYELV